MAALDYTISAAPAGGASRGVQVYRPAISVKLLKLVARRDGDAARYRGADREVDLTPYLGEGGAVQVVKDLAEPAGGFSIAFPDQIDRRTGDSIYAAFEPMDMIEIRAARQPEMYAGQPLPLIMRGFVSMVRRSVAMSADGEPQRTVSVSGQDSGKLWQINRFFPEALYASLEDPYLDTYRMQAANGLELAWQPVSQFLTDLTERVINKRIGDLAVFARRQGSATAGDAIVKPFRVDATVRHGIVSALQVAPFQGAFWGLADMVADRPWNELFVEDEEEGPLLRFRPTPYRDLQRRLIMAGADDPGTISMDVGDITSMDWSRTDSRVANFFWTPPGSSMLDSGHQVTIASIANGEVFDKGHPNNARELYGLRKMEAPTALLPEDIVSIPEMLPPAERENAGAAMAQWHIARMAQLKAMNRDNAVLEDGEAACKGHERLKPGRYLRITSGALAEEAYITRVAHTFTPLQTWTTGLTLERGTGFLERNRTAGMPFYAEGRRGPYDR